jgi:hypothetical protein
LQKRLVGVFKGTEINCLLDEFLCLPFKSYRNLSDSDLLIYCVKQILGGYKNEKIKEYRVCYPKACLYLYELTDLFDDWPFVFDKDLLNY